VVLGAILVVRADSEAILEDSMDTRPAPLACLEILGCSVVERMAERFLASDAEAVTVLVDSRIFPLLPAFRKSHPRVNIESVDDLPVAVERTLKTFCDDGIDYALVSTAGAYTECDFIDLLWFHRGSHQPITKVINHKSVLDLWIVDCAKVQSEDLMAAISGDLGYDPPTYLVSEYVNPLASLRDVRQMALDALSGRCGVRPAGREIRPGVWVDERADIHKRARLVAPSYIGRGSRICEDAVITRCSSIESLSQVDFGTVVDDSSVLSNSYVGIWLDVSHAVVWGSRLFSLGRGVELDISDGSVLRQNVALAQEARRAATSGTLGSFVPGSAKTLSSYKNVFAGDL